MGNAISAPNVAGNAKGTLEEIFDVPDRGILTLAQMLDSSGRRSAKITCR